MDQKKYYEHQLVWYVETGRWPSHDINPGGSKLNNVYSNLRLATMSQNLANQKLSAVNTSGVKGVTLYQRGSCVRWVAQIHTMKKHYHLGYFKTKEAASAAYGEAAQKLFGTFSRPEHKKG